MTHEGFVRHVHSIIEPTKYELYDPKTGEDIDYLYSTTTDLDLSHYNGKHIIVTGEEGLAQRWKDTPVLTVQNIQVSEVEVMAADNLIDGRAIAAQIQRELAARVAGLKKIGVIPGLAFVRVGEDAASKVYVGRKEKACAELGIFSET